MNSFTLKKTAPYQYITMEREESAHADIIRRCTVENLQRALEANGITNAEVVWAEVRSGKNLNPEHPLLKNLPPFPFHNELLEQIPEFCDVLIHETTPGHVADVSVWAPLDWNGRFLGCGGGGIQTVNDIRLFESTRSDTIACAVRNGFASACTDGGNKDPRMLSWGLDEVTGELDWEMVLNWSHRSIHSMTVIGKIITEALYGQGPAYSYYQGASGGGRMGLVEAQKYPEDYDGVWCDAPATNHARFQMAGCWPMYVMNWRQNFLSTAKLNAFRTAILEQYACGDGYLDSTDPVPFDPFTAVGRETEDGPITELDAETMKEIFDGPHTRSGERLFYSFWPGTYTWDPSGLGLINYIPAEDGHMEPFCFMVPEGYVSTWVAQDAKWDWKAMTREEYEELFWLSQWKFKDVIEGERSDFSAFRDRGGKLMLSHCANDPLVFPGGTIDLYHRVTQRMGGEESTLPFLRFFLTPDGNHCGNDSLGITMADGMIALMNWVEGGKAPETLPIERYDITTMPNTLTLRKEGRLYRLSGHPDNRYALPPIYDTDDTPLERKRFIRHLMYRKKTDPAAASHVDENAGASAKRLTSNPLFGSGQ